MKEELKRLMEQRAQIYSRLDMMGDVSNETTRDLYRQIRELDEKIADLQSKDAELEGTEITQEIEGVRKTKIQEIIDAYHKSLNQEDINAKIAELENNIKTHRDVMNRLILNNGNPEYIRNHEEKIAELENEIKTLAEQDVEKISDEEKTRIEDVLPELEDLLATSNPDLEYVPVEEIRKRIEDYKQHLAELLARKNRVAGNDKSQIASLEAKLKESAARMKEYKNAGFYDQEAAEHAEYNRLLEEINKLKIVSKPSEELANLEAKLKESAARMKEYKEAGFYDQEAAEHATYNELLKKINELKENKKSENSGKDDEKLDEEIRKTQNKIKELEDLEKLKEKFNTRVKDDSEIEIPEDPTIQIAIDDESLKAEYERRQNDMYAKYFGDKDYEREYKERVARHKEHEIEVEKDGITYRTIKDYEQKEADEKFLLLKGYKEALERVTRYEAGDTSVYTGDQIEIDREFKKDKEFVETRNYTFDQHKNTNKDLATMGKYGEKMPYIPKPDKFWKNIYRVPLNIMILGRNIVAPAYRFVGRFIAQPIHKALFKKEASPYKNNIYHRMVARRDYFADKARLKDEAATQEKIAKAPEGKKVKEVKHPVRNWFSSRFNAIFRSKEGNEAVLRAGTYDIRQDLMSEYTTKAGIDTATRKAEILIEQVRKLEEDLAKNPNAKNAKDVKKAIDLKKNSIEEQKAILELYGMLLPETMTQTDAVSAKQHAVASKEVNTLRTTVIKGFAKGVVRKYIGPKIKQWLLERAQTKKTELVPAETEEQWVDPKTEEQWVEGSTEEKWIDAETEEQWVDPKTEEEWVPAVTEKKWVDAETEEQWVDAVTEKKWVEPETEEQWVDAITEKKWVEPETEEQWVDAITEKKWVDEETAPIFGETFDTSKTAEEIINANAGKEVTMFYKVDAGEIAPRGYTIDGDDTITGIFQRSAEGNIGLSDAAGFKAPVMGDQTFDASMLEADGLLKQGTTVEELIDAVGSGKVDPQTYEDLYVSVSDRGWVKLSELCEDMKVTEKIGEEVIKPGYWEEVVVKPGYMETVEVTPGYYDEVVITPGHMETVEVKPGYWEEVVTKPGYMETVEVKPGYWEEVVTKPGYMKTVEIEPGHYETVEIKPGYFETVEKPGHFETVEIEPGHYETVIIKPEHYVEKIVTNPRAMRAIDTLAKAGKFGIGVDSVYDVFENLRNTHTDVQTNKSERREYTFESNDTQNIPTSRRAYKSQKAENVEREDDEYLVDWIDGSEVDDEPER